MYQKNFFSLNLINATLAAPSNQIFASKLTKKTKPDLIALRRLLWSNLVLYTLVQSPSTYYYLTKCPIFYAAI